MTRVAVIGQVVVDQIVRGTESLSAVAAEFDDTNVGGKAFNIAAAVARWGADVQLVTAVGSDAEGKRALKKMKKLGIGYSFVRQVGGRGGRVVGTPVQWTYPVRGHDATIKTPRVRLTEGRYGEREVQLVQDDAINDYYRAAVAAVDANDFDVIIFTLEFDDALLYELANVIQQRTEARDGLAPLIVANPAPHRLTGPVVHALNLAHVLTPNRYEAAGLIGGALDPAPSGETAGRLVNTYGNCEWATVTYGAQGWSWGRRGRPGEGTMSGSGGLPAASVRNKIGASDVFTAIIALMKCGGAPIEAATVVAGAAARIAVGREGGAVRFPTVKEVEHEVVALGCADASSVLTALRGVRPCDRP